MNKLIFAHSMGNLILAAAIKNKHCELGEKALWYNIQGPNKGSEVADVLLNACTEEGLYLPTFDRFVELALAYAGISYIPGTSQVLLKLLLNVGGYCLSNAHRLHPAYYELLPSKLF